LARPGLLRFAPAWAGQLVSLLGSGLTMFGLSVLVFEQSGSVTRYSVLGIAATVPGLVTIPFAGALVDRIGWRRALLLCNGAAGAVVLALSFAGGGADLPPLWAVALFVGLLSIAQNMHTLAFGAMTAALVPAADRGRAAGMTDAAHAVGQIAAPLLGAVLLHRIGLKGILRFDFVTFAAALAAVLPLRQEPTAAAAGDGPSAARAGWKADLAFGWRWVRERPGLLWLAVLASALNFSIGLAEVLFTPLVLSMASPEALARVLSGAAVGFLAGSVAMAAWGGPRRKLRGMLGAAAAFGALLIGGAALRTPAAITAAATAIMALVPVMSGCTQAIWLSKVAPELQGRVFSGRYLIDWLGNPLARVVAGPLSDRFAEPWLAQPRFVSPWVGWGAGRGIALLLGLSGLVPIAGVLLVLWSRSARRVEEDLPDWSPAGRPA